MNGGTTPYDATRCQWYVYDNAGIAHYGDTPWDAEEDAERANAAAEDGRGIAITTQGE